MALEIRTQKISRNTNNPQIDFEVVYADEELGFQTTRVFTFPVDEELTDEKVHFALEQAAQELENGLKVTMSKEADLRDKFQGKVFTLTKEGKIAAKESK